MATNQSIQELINDGNHYKMTLQNLDLTEYICDEKNFARLVNISTDITIVDYQTIVGTMEDIMKFLGDIDPQVPISCISLNDLQHYFGETTIEEAYYKLTLREYTLCDFDREGMWPGLEWYKEHFNKIQYEALVGAILAGVREVNEDALIGPSVKAICQYLVSIAWNVMPLQPEDYDIDVISRDEYAELMVECGLEKGNKVTII